MLCMHDIVTMSVGKGRSRKRGGGDGKQQLFLIHIFSLSRTVFIFARLKIARIVWLTNPLNALTLHQDDIVLFLVVLRLYQHRNRFADEVGKSRQSL